MPQLKAATKSLPTARPCWPPSHSYWPLPPLATFAKPRCHTHHHGYTGGAGGMLYGWKAGLALGLVFGLTSFYKAPSELLVRCLAQTGFLPSLRLWCVPRALVGFIRGPYAPLLKREKLRNIPGVCRHGSGGQYAKLIFLPVFHLLRVRTLPLQASPLRPFWGYLLQRADRSRCQRRLGGGACRVLLRTRKKV